MSCMIICWRVSIESAAHEVDEGRECRLSAFAHGDYDLLIGNVCYVAGGVDALDGGAAAAVNLYFAAVIDE